MVDLEQENVQDPFPLVVVLYAFLLAHAGSIFFCRHALSQTSGDGNLDYDRGCYGKISKLSSLGWESLFKIPGYCTGRLGDLDHGEAATFLKFDFRYLPSNRGWGHGRNIIKPQVKP